MGYIPEDVKWFIAEIVNEITVEGDPRNVVHINYNLIRACSPDEAFEKAVKLGREGETEYDNSDGKLVEIRFRGFHDLYPVYDELEDGAELLYEERVAVPEEEVTKHLAGKEDLQAFRPWRPPDFSVQPDYAAKDIIERLETDFGTKRFDQKKD